MTTVSSASLNLAVTTSAPSAATSYLQQVEKASTAAELSGLGKVLIARLKDGTWQPEPKELTGILYALVTKYFPHLLPNPHKGMEIAGQLFNAAPARLLPKTLYLLGDPALLAALHLWSNDEKFTSAMNIMALRERSEAAANISLREESFFNELFQVVAQTDPIEAKRAKTEILVSIYASSASQPRPLDWLHRHPFVIGFMLSDDGQGKILIGQNAGPGNQPVSPLAETTGAQAENAADKVENLDNKEKVTLFKAGGLTFELSTEDMISSEILERDGGQSARLIKYYFDGTAKELLIENYRQ
jgi:hypothetical protein